MLGRVRAFAIALGAAFWACSSSSSGPTTIAGDDGGTSNAPRDDASADTPPTQPDDDASHDSSIVDSAPDADLCAVAAPGTCPTAVPSFAGQVLPILEAKCNGCHTGALGEPWALTNWVDVNAWAISISTDLTHCLMPPADAGAANLTKAELEALLGWIVCGAPNN